MTPKKAEVVKKMSVDLNPKQRVFQELRSGEKNRKQILEETKNSHPPLAKELT